MVSSRQPDGQFGSLYERASRVDASAPSRTEPGGSALDVVQQENVVRLAGYLDVRSVGDVRRELNDLIDTTDGDVIVDLEAVDAVDATGLGLLVAAHRRVERLGRNLGLRPPGAAGGRG